MKITSIKVDPDLWQKLKEVALRERRDVQDIINEKIGEYVQVHGSGNPTYKITQWVNNTGMRAYPAFKTNRSDWQDYIEKLNDEKQINEISAQAQSILSFTEKKLKYGTTNVIVK